MIKFDPSKLRIDIVLLKSVTTSLGGSITVVEQSSGKDEFVRQAVPMAVARAFIQRCKKVTKYLKPTLTAVVKYDGLVVALERHPLGSMGVLHEDQGDGTMRKWRPVSEMNLELYVKPLASTDKQWFFDGRYVYRFDREDVMTAAMAGSPLTNDGKFRNVQVHAIDLQNLPSSGKIEGSKRSCMAFIASTGVVSVSPPIWKELAAVGGRQLGRATQIEDEDDADDQPDDEGPATTSNSATTIDTSGMFDRIDETLAVNLNFALKAGQEIGQLFGYDCVEPLHLPRLMIELHTVNLPGVQREVKATYDIGLKFTHAMAWLLGMSRYANDLDTMLMMRSLMKYLTKRGIFRRNVFNPERVFIGDHNYETIPLLSYAELAERDVSSLSLSMVLSQARQNKLSGIHNIGGLMTED